MSNSSGLFEASSKAGYWLGDSKGPTCPNCRSLFIWVVRPLISAAMQLNHAAIPGERDESLEMALKPLAEHADVLCASAFHGRRLQASSCKISPDTFHAFNRYILPQLPQPAPVQVETTPPAAIDKRSSSDTWKSTFGMNTLSSYLAMPSFSGNTLPRSQSDSAVSTPPVASHGKTWTRVISLGLYGGSEEKPPETSTSSEPSPPAHVEASVDADEIAEAMESDSDDSVADHIARLVAKDPEAKEDSEEGESEGSIVERDLPSVRVQEPSEAEQPPEEPQEPPEQTKEQLKTEEIIPAPDAASVATSSSSAIDVSSSMRIFCPSDEAPDQWGKALWVSVRTCRCFRRHA
jgi:hypothetical protein